MRLDYVTLSFLLVITEDFRKSLSCGLQWGWPPHSSRVGLEVTSCPGVGRAMCQLHLAPGGWSLYLDTGSGTPPRVLSCHCLARNLGDPRAFALHCPGWKACVPKGNGLCGRQPELRDPERAILKVPPRGELGRRSRMSGGQASSH